MPKPREDSGPQNASYLSAWSHAGSYRYVLMAAYWFAFFITVVFSGLYSWHSWHRYEKDGRARLALTTALVATTTSESLDAESSGLIFLAQRLQHMDALQHPLRARQLLVEYQKAFPAIASAEVIVPDGQVVASTAVPAGLPLPNFRENPRIWGSLRASLTRAGFHIHRPLRGPLVGRWVIGFSDTVFSSQGKPLFLVTTPIRFRHFEGLLAHLPLPPGLAVGVMRDDYYIEGREPVPHDKMRALLDKPQTGALVHALKNHPSATRGTFEGRVSTDDLYRFGAFVRIPGYRLVAFSGVPRSLWLARWWHRQIEIPFIFLLTALAFSGFAYRRIQMLGARWEQEKEQQETVLQGLVTLDPLTGLMNRKGLFPALKNALTRAERDGRFVAVGFLDVDDFKAINDERGHAVGDAVLKELAGRLRGILRVTDHVARLGGDEFVLLIEGLRKREDLDGVIASLKSGLESDFIVNGQSIAVRVSLGLALYPCDDGDAERLLHHADQAMYAAKARSREAREQWVRIYQNAP